MAFTDKDGKTAKERKHEYDVRYNKEHPRDRTRDHRYYYVEHHDERLAIQKRNREKKRVLSDFFIKAAKVDGCVDCGEKDLVVLDLDHIGADKLGEVSVFRNYGSVERLLNEIAKCEPRCANCHRRMTAKRGYRGVAA